MVANKQKPFYRCTETCTPVMGGTTFHIGWEYQIDYVESRLKAFPHLLNNFTKYE